MVYNVLFKKSDKDENADEGIACPKCSSSRKEGKKNRKSLSYNHKIKAGKCHHCETVFVENEVVKSNLESKNYIKPVYNNMTKLSDRLVLWFQGRGISQQTLMEMKVTEGMEYMPQVQKPVNTVQFNYFRDGILVNTKFRDGAKNFKLVKGAELILYNIDAIKDTEDVIICEGELDALSWYEAGFKNVVSVPNGASKGGKLDYLENCYEYFSDKKRIYLSTDNDEPGKILRDELVRRLGMDRCFKVDFGSLKDANEFLIYHEKEKMAALIENATDFPIHGTYNIDDIWERLEYVYNHGLPSGCSTGDRKLDEHIGFMPGELTVITGIPGHGKSIFLDQISLGLAMTEGWKFAVCSPESYPLEFYFSRLIKRIVGQRFSKRSIPPVELDNCRSWIRDKYYMIMPDTGFSLDEILEKTKALVLRKGVRALIIDPWNRIEKNQPKNMNEGQWIAVCLTKIIEFAQRCGIHIFLVAHPYKMQKDKGSMNYMLPNLYSISGSAHFFNMTHNGMTVYRNFDSGKTEVHIQKVKWEHLGKIGMIEYVYNTENARFDSIHGSDYTNWIKTKVFKTEPEQLTMDQEITNLLKGSEPPF